MALQFSVGLRNAILDQMETTTGVSAVLKIFTGAVPASCVTADSGTLLASYTLDSDWMANASAGAKAMQKSASVLSGANFYTASGAAPGSAGYFRIYPSTPTTTNATMQGTVTATGGGGDMTIDNVVIAAAQTVNVTGFVLTAPGA